MCDFGGGALFFSADMNEDADLLRRYVDERSETAFAELVRRRIGLVYAIAWRRTQDTHLAQEVAQVVFTALARKAPQLVRHQTLLGWLYRSAHFAASDSVRARDRRQRHEQEALVMQPLETQTPEPDWRQLSPIVDEVLSQMPAADRDAVLLRVVDERSYGEIGRNLGVGESGARMRVERALERMRQALVRRGITSTAAALTLAIGQQSGAAIPNTLTSVVASKAISAAAGMGGVSTLLIFMGTTKTTIAVSAALLLAAAGWISQYRTTIELRQEVAALHRAIEYAPESATERKPAASAIVTAPKTAAAESRLAPNYTAKAEGGLPSQSTGLRPAVTWMNRGTATAADALESYLWAVEQIDAETTAKTIGFGTKRAQVEAYFNGLSDAVRAKYHTPEELWAAILTAAPHSQHITAFQILSQNVDSSLGANFLELRVRTVKDDALTEEGTIRFELTAAGWRRSIDDRASTLIDPVFNLFQSTAKP